MLFRFCYNILVIISWNLAKLIAPFYPDLHKFVNGRKIPKHKRNVIKKHQGKTVWMHCASLGEYEQGRSVLEKIRVQKPDTNIILSFFSPSGYDEVKADDVLDHVLYLPVDSSGKVKNFIEDVGPDLVLFVKYDFWFNYLHELNQKRIPVVYLSVILTRESFLFKWYGKFILNELRKIDRIFVQDDGTMGHLIEFGFKNLKKNGDTRLDSVLNYVRENRKDPLIEKFMEGSRPLIITGSAWQEEIDLIASLDPAIFDQYKWIIAPHQIEEEMVEYIQKSLNARATRYTDRQLDPEADVLILDTIGVLKFIYRYAKIVIIGGGFGKGIHNTLEPAAYGKTVIFGPEYDKFLEAKSLVDANAFFSVKNSMQLAAVLIELQNEQKYQNAHLEIKNYMDSHSGSSNSVMSYLERFWN